MRNCYTISDPTWKGLGLFSSDKTGDGTQDLANAGCSITEPHPQPFHLFLFNNVFVAGVCERENAGTDVPVHHLEVRRQLVEVGFLSFHQGFWGSKTGCRLADEAFSSHRHSLFSERTFL